MVKFSIVCPIKDEADLIPITLPSFYPIKPCEVILCLDKPANKRVVKAIHRVTSFLDVEDITKIIEVKRNPEYFFHQSWVRRTGFMEAESDRILTIDIDLVVNRNVLKAVDLVGKDNIGLASCSKHYPYKGFQKIWRNITYEVVRFAYPIRFTGLYAIWRPYWLDSEDQDIKKLHNPRYGSYNEVSTGEDTYLRNCMIKKHRVVYLKDIGATVLTYNIGDLPATQFEQGRYFASQGYNIFRMLAKVFLYWRMHLLSGWLYERRRMKCSK